MKGAQKAGFDDSRSVIGTGFKTRFGILLSLARKERGEYQSRAEIAENAEKNAVDRPPSGRSQRRRMVDGIFSLRTLRPLREVGILRALRVRDQMVFEPSFETISNDSFVPRPQPPRAPRLRGRPGNSD